MKKPLDLEAIRERLEKATPGPWYATIETYRDTDEDDRKRNIWTVGPEKNKTNWTNDSNTLGYGMLPNDALLAAHAPSDLKALLEEVETLRAAVVEMAKALEESCFCLEKPAPEASDCSACLALRLPAVVALRTEKTS